jgi:hypothetical protein
MVKRLICFIFAGVSPRSSQAQNRLSFEAAVLCVHVSPCLPVCMDLAELGITLLADDAIDFSEEEAARGASDSCAQPNTGAAAPAVQAEAASVDKWTHDECIAWLKALPEELGLQLQAVENDTEFCGSTLIAAAASTRELRDTLGLATITQRLAFDEALKAAATAGAKPAQYAKATRPSGSTGGIYDPAFLELVKPLYDMHMGVENMGPLLYTLVRFVKPQRVLEIGAGYTTVFLLMALKDNAAELANYSALRAQEDACIVEQTTDDSGSASSRTIPWCVDVYMDSAAASATPVLHCVDNMAHQHTTGEIDIQLISVQQRLKCSILSVRLRLHECVVLDTNTAVCACFSSLIEQ